MKRDSSIVVSVRSREQRIDHVGLQRVISLVENASQLIDGDGSVLVHIEYVELSLQLGDGHLMRCRGLDVVDELVLADCARLVCVEEVHGEVGLEGRRFDATASKEVGDLAVAQSAVSVLVQTIEDITQLFIG